MSKPPTGLYAVKIEHWNILHPLVVTLWQRMRLLQGAPQDPHDTQPWRMLYNPRCLHKRDLCKNYVGNYWWRTILFWKKPGGIGLCPGTSLPVPWIHHWSGTQCTAYSACNLPKAMDDCAGARSSTRLPQVTFPKPSAHSAPSSWLAQCQSHTTGTGTGATGIAKALNKERRPPPKNRLLIDPYLSRYNNYIDLSAILTASRKRIGDLPSMPQHCTPTGTSLILGGGTDKIIKNNLLILLFFNSGISRYICQ